MLEDEDAHSLLASESPCAENVDGQDSNFDEMSITSEGMQDEGTDRQESHLEEAERCLSFTFPEEEELPVVQTPPIADEHQIEELPVVQTLPIADEQQELDIAILMSCPFVPSNDLVAELKNLQNNEMIDNEECQMTEGLIIID